MVENRHDPGRHLSWTNMLNHETPFLGCLRWVYVALHRLEYQSKVKFLPCRRLCHEERSPISCRVGVDIVNRCGWLPISHARVMTPCMSRSYVILIMLFQTQRMQIKSYKIQGEAILQVKAKGHHPPPQPPKLPHTGVSTSCAWQVITSLIAQKNLFPSPFLLFVDETHLAHIVSCAPT